MSVESKVIKGKSDKVEDKILSAVPVGKKRIDGKVYEASQQAKQIIDDALKEAEQIREIEKKKGFDAGYEQGLRQVAEVLVRFKQEKERVLSEIEPQVVMLVRKIAEKIIGKELELNNETIVNIVKQALQPVKQQKEIIIRVNPQDVEILEKNKAGIIDVLARTNDISIKPDDSVVSGGCIVETEIGTIDARLDTQLRVLEQVLVSTE